MLELVIGQLTNVRTVSLHDVNLAVGLAVVRVQRRLVLEPTTRAREGNPLAVGNSGEACCDSD
jgi:hypothetical protein